MKYLYCLFSSPEPKARKWAYRKARHPCPSPSSAFSNDISLKPWSRFLPNVTYSIYRQEERKILFLFQSDKCGCYGNLYLPLTYNEKNENWHLLLSHCRYFDKTFIEMFLERSSTKHSFLLQPLNLIGYHGNPKAKFAKNFSKINSSEAVWGIKLKLCSIVSNVSLNILYCRYSSTFVAMAT